MLTNSPTNSLVASMPRAQNVDNNYKNRNYNCSAPRNPVARRETTYWGPEQSELCREWLMSEFREALKRHTPDFPHANQSRTTVAVALLRIGGWTYDEIAGALPLARTSVARHVAAAKAHLREGYTNKSPENWLFYTVLVMVWAEWRAGQ